MKKIAPEINKERAIRSFVVRQGRMTDAQKRAWDKMFSVYGLSINDGMLDYDKVFQRKAPVILEIGFGMGDSLLELAKQHPENNYIGVEVHPPGVGALLKEIEANDISNIRIFCSDVIDVLINCIPVESLQSVLIFFPDPWPKKKHHKRRLVRRDVVELIVARLLSPTDVVQRNVLLDSRLRGKDDDEGGNPETPLPRHSREGGNPASGGILHVATDWKEYAEECLTLLDTFTDLRNLAGPGHYSERGNTRPETKFERRGKRLGHGVYDLRYEKKKKA